jgi:16S rRNA (uracil1498-N3)-methyltransferase
MPRFFARLEGQDRAVITGKDVHHITGPLRRRAGDELPIRAGEQGFIGRIVSAGPRGIVLEILYPQELRDRGRARVHLGMSLIDLKDFDTVVRGATELGVSVIHPLVAERSNVRAIRGKTTVRWQQIALEAVKQCGRRTVPEIRDPMGVPRFLEDVAASWPTRLVASLSSGLSLRECRAPEAGILIGPEGGFSPGEEEMIAGAGFTPVHMGRTVLRSVTAALTATGILAMQE